MLMLFQARIIIQRDVPNDTSMITDERRLKPYILTEKATDGDEATMRGSLHHDGFHAFRSRLPRIQYNFSGSPTAVELDRRGSIKAAFQHAWNDGYSKEKGRPLCTIELIHTSGVCAWA